MTCVFSHMPSNKLCNKLVKVKDHLEDTNFSGAYKIPCMDCSYNYTGETGKLSRVKEPKCDIDKSNHVSNAQTAHAHKCNHFID